MSVETKKKGFTLQKQNEPFTSVEDELREIKAAKIVRKYMLWSMGAGIIPVPLIDIGISSGVQLKMLGALSRHYQIPFYKNVGKSAIATLLGFITANSLRGSVVTSFLKAIPGVGLLGTVSMPIYSGALTYAIGKTFVLHFESGGTFLTFKPYKVKEHFKKLYQEGQNLAANLKGGSN
jgi:uncharacterized protein (DUF697 family)